MIFRVWSKLVWAIPVVPIRSPVTAASVQAYSHLSSGLGEKHAIFGGLYMWWFDGFFSCILLKAILLSFLPR